MNLCEKLNISPQEYILIKEFLIRESMKTGFITRDFADNNIKIGFNKDQIKIFYLISQKKKG